ncbi:transposase [Mesorhizobium sp. M0306]
MVDLASAAGSSVTEVAEAFGVAPSQLYAWRKQMAGGELEADRAVATFARIEVNDLPEVERPVADCPDPPADTGETAHLFNSWRALRHMGCHFLKDFEDAAPPGASFCC